MSLQRVLCISLAVVGLTWSGLLLSADDKADKPDRVAEILEDWTAQISGVKEFHQMYAVSDDQTLATAAFRGQGQSFGSLWNHYAKLCGIEKSFDPKSVQGSSQRTTKGTCVLSEKVVFEQPERRTSVFLLKTTGYVVTVTLQSEPGDQSVSGSLSVVME